MKPIERIPLLDASVRSIKEYILSGETKVGEKLPTENDFCQRLCVGRSTVREALRTLQAMGFVEMRPGKGAFVKRTQEMAESDVAVRWFIDNQCKISEALEFRRFLEPCTARLAAMRITGKELAELTRIMEKFEEAYNQNDVLSLTLYEEAFHTAIVKAGHNALFVSIHKSIATFLKSYFTMSMSIKQTAQQSLEPHKRIYMAIKLRNADQAEAEMTAHMRLTVSNMLDVIAGNTPAGETARGETEAQP